MKIEHKLSKWQIKWGFLWWSKDKNNLYQKLFPKKEFTINVLGKIIKNRKVDWGKNRLFISVSELAKIKENDTIVIRGSPNTDEVEIITK